MRQYSESMTWFEYSWMSSQDREESYPFEVKIRYDSAWEFPYHVLKEIQEMNLSAPYHYVRQVDDIKRSDNRFLHYVKFRHKEHADMFVKTNIKFGYMDFE